MASSLQASGAGGGSGWEAVLQTKLYRWRKLIGRYWWLTALAVAVGAGIGIWSAKRLTAAYLSTGRIMVSGQLLLQDGAGYSEAMSTFLGDQIQLIKDASVRGRAEARIATLHPEVPASPAYLEVRTIPTTSVFALEIRGTEPRYTRLLLDGVMQEYIAEKREIRAQKSQGTQSALRDEVVRVEAEMARVDEALIDFQRKNNVGFLEQEGNSAGAYLARQTRNLADLNKELQLMETFDVEQNVERMAQRGNARATTSGESVGEADLPSSLGSGGAPSAIYAEYLRTRQRLEMVRASRADYGRDLKPRHPIMMELEQQIRELQSVMDGLKQQVAQQFKNRKEALRLEVANLQKVIKEWEKKALDLSERLASYNQLRAKQQSLRQQCDRLIANESSVQVTRTVDQDIVSIREPATNAVLIEPPRSRHIALGLAGGLLLGLVILGLIDLFDDRIASMSEFEPRFSEPMLAQIPRQPGKKGMVHCGRTTIDTPSWKPSARCGVRFFICRWRACRQRACSLPVLCPAKGNPRPRPIWRLHSRMQMRASYWWMATCGGVYCISSSD
jgi:uncharacterized protein involved in exopolysaccharide biosynthesis